MRRPFAAVGALALAALATWLVSCKSNSYTTQPTPSGELASTTLAAGAGAYPHTFHTLGTFRYKCTIHPSCTSLQGTVTVVSAGTPIASDVTAITFSGGSVGGPYGGGTCSSLSDPRDTVHVGETVTWTNASPLPHTVTSY